MLTPVGGDDRRVVDLAGWVAALDELVELISARFTRVEPRRRVGTYLRGLLAGLERKNGWTLAEHAGAVSPDGMQRLLRTAGWDVHGVRDDVRRYVLDHLGDQASGVFIIDDTGFIKKGVRSAGVARQYTGTTGKVDNCQIGVSSPTPAAVVGRWSTGSSTYPLPGPRTVRVAPARVSRTRSGSPPSPSSGSPCSSARIGQGCCWGG